MEVKVMTNLKNEFRGLIGNEQTKSSFSTPEKIAEYIAYYGHDNQVRENGSAYTNHPKRMQEKYKKLIGMNFPGFDLRKVIRNQIPYFGVIEVCWLHDVWEDTKVGWEIKQPFEDVGYGEYFKTYIEEPLKLITHDKEEGYEEYIEKVLSNPTSALVKLLDLNDNLDIFDLASFDENKAKRMNDYVHWINVIENKYHFLEKIKTYRDSAKALLPL